MKKFTLDGLQVDLSDADAVTAAFTKLQGKVTDAETAKATAEAKTVTDAATIVAKDAEITKLTADLAAAKLTPQQMRDAGKAYALVVDKAKASGVTVTDEMDEGAIMKAVVDKAMGDKAKGYSDEYVAIAFEALTKDIKTADQKIVPFVPVNDSADAETSTAYAKMVADMTTAHRPSQAA